MKKLLTFLFLAVCQFSFAQKHKLVQLWTTEAVVATPESVLPDMKNNMLYVSLIDGEPWGLDGKGGIGRMTMMGTNYDSLWFTGLNAPKGLGVYRNNLYAADISDVVVVDVPSAKLKKKISIEGASGLNDITVSEGGAVYVSDSKTGRIWKITDDKPVLYLENITGANGLKSVKDDLYFAKGSA
ncbi:MAG TPA: ATP-binding protein, partial [Puia sp.]